MSKPDGEDETLDVQEDAEVENQDEEEVVDEESEETETEDENKSEDDQDASDDDEDEGGDSEAEKQKKIANNQRIRAEKAEAELKKLKGDGKTETKKPATSTKAQELTSADQYTLLRNNVHEDDVSEVVAYAKLKKISVSEALKSPIVKSTLKDSEEKRKTSQATSRGKEGRRGSYQVPIATLLANAKKGIMPENDADLDRLVDAQMASRKKRNK